MTTIDTLSPAPAFTDEQLQRLGRYNDRIDQDIDELLDDQRRVVAHAFAATVRSVFPTASSAGALIVDTDQLGPVYCEVNGTVGHVPGPVIIPDLCDALLSMMRRLPLGHTVGSWHRSTHWLSLAFSPDMADGNRYPFKTVQERLLKDLEQFTSRIIRKVVLGTEEWENGYFFSDTVLVEFSEGDRDDIDVEDMWDYSPELREHVDGLGPHTTLVITRTDKGVRID